MTKISDETNIEKIEHKSKKNIALGTIIGYLSILVSIAHGFFLTTKVMTSVGVDNYGLYGIATSLVSLFLLDFGLSTTSETYLAKLRAKGDKKGVEKFLASIFKFYLLIDAVLLVVLIALYFASPYIYRSSYSPEQLKVLQLLIVIVGGYTLVSFPSTSFFSAIQTYEKFGFNKTADLVQKVIYFVLTILTIKYNWGVIGITAVNAGSLLVAVVMRFLFMRYYLGVRLDLKLKLEKSDLKQVFTFSAWGLIMAIFSRLAYYFSPNILGMVSSNDQVSMFMLVNTIETYVCTFGAMTAYFFMAKVARVQASGSEEEKRIKLQLLAEKVGKVQFFVIALIYFGFLVVGQNFLQIWIKDQLVTNPDFKNIYWCIIIMCAYELVRIPELPLQNAMLTRGEIKPLAIVVLIKAVVNLGLSFALSYFHGAVGAAIAVGAARVLETILNNYCYKKYLGISITRFITKVYTGGAICITTIVILLKKFDDLVPLNSTGWQLVIKGFLFVILFTISYLTVSFNKEERKYYVGVVMEILHIKKKVKPAEIEESKNEEN